MILELVTVPSMKVLSLEELSKLGTKRLLAYYKKKRRLRYTVLEYYQHPSELHWYSDGKNKLYDYNKVNDYFNEVKAMLDEREHVEV